MSDDLPAWVSIGGSQNEHLSDLLSFASTNYGRQTEWFLRHRDTGIRNLAAIIAAESGITGLYFTTQRQIPSVLIIAVLLFLGLVAPLVAWTALRSCERAFMAAMESALLTAKTAWALGLISEVDITGAAASSRNCPARDDPYLYVTRWTDDALEHRTTKAYVDANLSNRKNTYFLARVTTWIFCVGALAVAIVGVCAMVFRA